MPWDEVMHKFKTGKLRSGSSKGPKVKNRKQAIAIMLSEKREAQGGKDEYKSKKKKKRKAEARRRKIEDRAKAANRGGIAEDIFGE